MLPKGFKFESYDTIKRQLDQAKQLNAKIPINKRRKEKSVKKPSKSEDEEVAPVPHNKRGRPRKNPEALSAKPAVEQDIQSQASEYNKRMSFRPKKPVNFYEQSYLEKINQLEPKKPQPKEKEQYRNVSSVNEIGQKDIKKPKISQR